MASTSTKMGLNAYENYPCTNERTDHRKLFDKELVSKLRVDPKLICHNRAVQYVLLRMG